MHPKNIELDRERWVHVMIHTAGHAMPVQTLILPMTVTFCRIRDEDRPYWHLTYIEVESGENKVVRLKHVTGWREATP